MNAILFSIGSSRDSSPRQTAGLPRWQQVRCHLACAARQIAQGHFRRIGFHLRGITRAVWGD
jgi:hypothetical protein